MFPWSLRFEPNEEFSWAYKEPRFYNAFIEGGDDPIEPNTLLYKVYAKHLPDSLDSDEILIGRIET